ncbi:methyltransferase [Flavipsychrobacter stenotrophus]|uniref:Methyltransferase n=1 Tax=Flavipsychrobacter stenotrophus TaxID=2077091 RepID=A0A2S7SSA9_9BACT|nr:DNA adenine methylase [Flavipsychrobacter stenotrophus]PQJ09485.1 methyltransferase [Flavipsychrobacter stenotrophus]
MKSAITYYGGKQKLVSTILPLFPEHILYSEPFAGGAALLFAKEPSEVEVINDLNTELINFYRVIQQDYVSLSQEIKITLHSRKLHSDASVVYNNPHLFTPLKRAWAVWVLATQSFASMLDGTWGYDKAKNTTSKKIHNKGVQFNEDYAIRLQNVQIECADALYIIKSRDYDKAFFYCDPPYFNSDCGHYGGYSLQDFERLLTALSEIKGKFLLSSYPSDILDQFVKRFGWYQKRVEQRVSVNKGAGKMKVEVMTANYPIE